MNNQELQTIEINPGLAVNLNENALSQLSEQRSKLKKFITSQLEKDVDYGIIPGTKKPSLYKPGAEKVANIFQLGSRIVKTDRMIDWKENVAMFAVTVEMYHLPTGKAIAQCEGITTSQEKKYATRMNYKLQKEEPTPIADVLNTLTKMAQKRAFVGAVLIACGASDFFTQDLEDTPREYFEQPPKKQVSNIVINQPTATTHRAPVIAKKAAEIMDAPQMEPIAPAAVVEPQDHWEPPTESGIAPTEYVVTFGKKHKGKTLQEIGAQEVEGYLRYILGQAQKDNKEITGQVLDFVNAANDFLASQNGGA